MQPHNEGERALDSLWVFPETLEQSRLACVAPRTDNSSADCVPRQLKSRRQRVDQAGFLSGALLVRKRQLHQKRAIQGDIGRRGGGGGERVQTCKMKPSCIAT